MPRFGQRKESHEAVATYVRDHMPKRVKALVRGALWDLHHGPLSKAEAKNQGIPNWPGFVRATKEIADWFRKSGITELYYNEQSGEVSPNEPAGYDDGDSWIEPVWEDYVKFESSSVKSAAFGVLAEYV